MKQLAFVLCFLSVGFTFSQHSAGLSASVNRFDVFTRLTYTYSLDNSFDIGVYSGLGSISLFTTGVPIVEFGTNVGYRLKVLENLGVAPTYFFNFLQQKVEKNRDLYFEHQIGYVLTWGDRNCLFQSTGVGWGKFQNQSVSLNYVAVTVNLGLRYAW